jgi:DNA mismatch repair ATPase MutS
MSQVGCPESGIEEAVQRLTAAGYKVGRIEQTETAAEAKQKRGNKVRCPFLGARLVQFISLHLMLLYDHAMLAEAAVPTCRRPSSVS